MAYISKTWPIFFIATSWLVALSITNIKTRTNREMTSRIKIKNFDFNGGNVGKHWIVAGEVFAISDCLVWVCGYTAQEEPWWSYEIPVVLTPNHHELHPTQRDLTTNLPRTCQEHATNATVEIWILFVCPEWALTRQECATTPPRYRRWRYE